MAKQSEEQKDQLFDMALGDGLIEVDEEQRAADETAEATKAEDDKKAKLAEDVTQYQDGSFEIDDSPASEAGKTSEEEDKETFIEKTEKEETGKTGKTPLKADQSDSSSSSPYLAFAKDRANEGVFLEFNDEDWKELLERNDNDEAAALRELSTVSMREMVRLGVESFKESITPEEKALYEAKEKGLPLDQYGLAKSEFATYSKIKEEDLAENVELQEKVVTKNLELRGFNPEEIKEEIEGYKALENLEAKAKKALPQLPKVFKKQMEDMEAGATATEQARQDGIRQRVARMKRMVETTPEIIPGIKLTKPTREKIMKSMTVPIAKDQAGNPLNPVMATRGKNPDAFEMMIHYYHSLGLFNIDDEGQMNPDFSKIAKVQKTKAADEMRSIFETTAKPIAGKAKIPETSDEELDEFDKAFGRL